MSRGPGRVMRAVLAELSDYGRAEVFGVAVRAYHDDHCGCGEFRDCYGFRPTRTQQVSARRALHALARDGVVELSRKRYAYAEHPDILHAVKRCQPGKSAGLATLSDIPPCFHCGRPLAQTKAIGRSIGTSSSSGLSICAECSHFCTDALALLTGGAS